MDDDHAAAGNVAPGGGIGEFFTDSLIHGFHVGGNEDVGRSALLNLAQKGIGGAKGENHLISRVFLFKGFFHRCEGVGEGSAYGGAYLGCLNGGSRESGGRSG